MPNIDGNELTSRIKKDQKNLPVIMLTALDAITDKKKSFNEGADDYIVKPVDFDELELRIRAILRRYGKVAAQKTVMGNTSLDYMTKTMYVNGKIVEADEQIRQVILSLQHQWEQKNLYPEVDLERVCITSNGDLCYLIWQNIISNAVKYSEPDSKISIKLCRQSDYLLFSVTNKGEPLKGKEDIIFEPFYTTDRSGTEKGTGLGLPLVKKTVNRLGGKITVSTCDGLNVFTVRLPLTC